MMVRIYVVLAACKPGYSIHAIHHLIPYLLLCMATHSSTLAWKIPWTEEPGRLQSMGLQRVGRD